MKKLTAIVYTSHTGFTRRYAGMLARASGIPAYDLSQRRELPAPGSAVLYLGWPAPGASRACPRPAGAGRSGPSAPWALPPCPPREWMGWPPPTGWAAFPSSISGADTPPAGCGAYTAS